MASEVACYLPGLFAAVAPVAGIVYQDCGGSPVPIVTFHGTDDYNVPFEFAPPAVADWAAHNGCDPGAITEQVTDHVSRITYPGCGRADVVFYVVDGGGHTWPGAEDDTGGVGPTTHEISASEIIWEFFAAHPRPD
jgi:polyhydroxybutyrate depolymerase